MRAEVEQHGDSDAAAGRLEFIDALRGFLDASCDLDIPGAFCLRIGRSVQAGEQLRCQTGARLLIKTKSVGQHCWPANKLRGR